jgi:hypothetical protein
MASPGPGITQRNIARFSRLRRVKEVFAVAAADDDYLVDDADISAAVVGDALTLTAAADGLLPWPDKITVKVTDASGTNLSLTVKLVGLSATGELQSESLTANGTPTVGTSAKVYSQLISATITAIANKAASDKANIGFAGIRMGLFHGIDKVSDVKRIIHDDAGTLVVIAISASTVDLPNQAIIITGAGNDRYVIEYLASTKKDGFAANGVWASV